MDHLEKIKTKIHFLRNKHLNLLQKAAKTGDYKDRIRLAKHYHSQEKFTLSKLILDEALAEMSTLACILQLDFIPEEDDNLQLWLNKYPISTEYSILIHLGDLYLGVKEKKALVYWEQAFNLKSAEAAFRLAEYYLILDEKQMTTSEKSSKSYQLLSNEWYSKASEIAEIQDLLTLRYLPPKNQSFDELFKTIPSVKDAEVIYHFACLCEEYDTYTCSLKKYEDWVRSFDSQCIWDSGIQSKHWFREALKRDGGNHFLSEKDRAFQYYLRAAEMGHDRAIIRVAEAYYCMELKDSQSEKQEINYLEKKSFKWYKVLLSQGEASLFSKMNLILSPDHGFDELFGNWCEQVYESDDAPLLYDLGLLFYKHELNERALVYLQKSADLKYTPAQHHLAYMYENRLGTSENEHKAMRLYCEGAENNYAYSLYQLACQNRQEKDTDTAYEYYLLAIEAKHNYGEAFHSLYLLNEEGAQLENQKLLNQKAIDAMEYQALTCLGKAYETGSDLREDIKQDLSVAKSIYLCASFLNNEDAFFNLGSMYGKGKGHEFDPNLSKYFYTRAADLGNAQAQYNLASLLFDEQTKDSRELALHWYIKAANQNHCESLYMAGHMLMNDGQAPYVERNPEQALYYYEQAASLKHNKAFYYLSLAYRKGKGVDIDFKKAFNYATMAVDNGYQFALWNLAYMYGEGIGTARNSIKAFEMNLSLANEGSNHYSMHEVGLAYENGNGVEKNLGEALRWYTAAAERGNVYSMNKLGIWYGCGKYVELDLERSFNYYKEAADKNFSVAIYNLAIIYAEGNAFLKKDKKKSLKLFQKAAALGYHEALEELRGEID